MDLVAGGPEPGRVASFYDVVVIRHVGIGRVVIEFSGRAAERGVPEENLLSARGRTPDFIVSDGGTAVVRRLPLQVRAAGIARSRQAGRFRCQGRDRVGL